MKSTYYAIASETSETCNFLRFLHSPTLMGDGVGNVGNTYRFPTFLRPGCAAMEAQQ